MLNSRAIGDDSRSHFTTTICDGFLSRVGTKWDTHWHTRNESMEAAPPPPQLISATVALISAGFAWVTFRVTRRDKKVADYSSLRRALTALRQDLGIISEWAPAYERKSLDEYRTLRNGQHYKDWRRPHRIVFRFNYDSVRSLRQNPPTPNFDTQLLSDLAVLDHAITNLFSLLDRYDRITQADATIIRKLYLKMTEEDSGQQVDYTEGEKELQEIAYRLNYQIHVDGIGAKEQKDKQAPGLHWAYEQAKQSLNRVESNLKQPSLVTYDHQLYIVGDLFAVAFFVLACALVAWIVAGLSLLKLVWRLIFSCF